MANVQDIIRRKALEYGVDPTTALAIAKIESNFNPAPTTGNGGGLYQFDKTNWANFGSGADVTDPVANADAFMRYYKGSLLPGLTKELGRMPTPGELYLAHQQGVKGAAALLANPSGIAADTLSGFYKDLPTAISAITGNGGQKDMTGQQFASLWNNRFNSAARSIDPNFAGADSAVVGVPGTPAMMVADATAAPPQAAPAQAPDTAASGKFDFRGLLNRGLASVESNQPAARAMPPLTPQYHPADLMAAMMLRNFDPFQTPFSRGAGLLGSGLV